MRAQRASKPPISGLVDRALGLLDRPGRVVLGTTGAPGAGKSTLASQLLAALRSRLGEDAVGHLPMDGFHLADVQLDRLGLRDRKGAPETFDVDGYVAALQRLHAQPDRTLYVPGFERDLEQPIAAAIAIPPSARLVITEGNYLLLPSGGWEHVRPLLAEAWFVDVDDDLRRERLVRRHEQFGKSPAAAREWVDRSDEPNAVLISAAFAMRPISSLTSHRWSGSRAARAACRDPAHAVRPPSISSADVSCLVSEVSAHPANASRR